jgi:hypothetical protein
MKRVFGLETEYGITIQGATSVDVVAESIELVRSYTEHGAHMKWDYRLEDPHRDARGFRAAQLLQDTDESAYYEIDRTRPLSFEEIKSDLVLSNGARFYNDHAHPEYSTPECTTLRQLVAHEKAGERILAECARRRNLKLPEGQEVRLFKNNTDFAGHSYGCHDNYLMRRDLPWDELVAGVLPFLITRQIFAGAGKIGIEAESAGGQPGVFQISQRADFFSTLVSIDTMNKRPLVNTRDEPHADADRYRRFHVIIGDSNMSEWATVLNDLERDVTSTRDRIDWAAKKLLLETFQEEEKLSWTDPWLQALDLEYHNIQPDQGLFYELLRQGSMRSIVSEKEIKNAIFAPPETTRAYFRGRAVARFNHAISSIQWDEISFRNGSRSQLVTLPEPAEGDRLEALKTLVRDDGEFEDFFRALPGPCD